MDYSPFSHFLGFIEYSIIILDQYHFAFLYESKIWLGANNIAAISNRIDLLIIPLNKNKTEGITDSASALNMLLFLKQIIQIAQYNTTNIASTIRYMANASSDHHPNHVPGMLIIIKSLQHDRQLFRSFYVCFMTCFRKFMETGIVQILAKFF